MAMNFTDPTTLALLGASAGFLDPKGGMGAGFQGALQGLQAGQDIQDRDLMRKKMQDQALQQVQAQEFLKGHQQKGTNPRDLLQAAAMSGNPHVIAAVAPLAKLMPSVKTTEKVRGEDGKVYTRPIMTDGTRGEIGDMEVAEKLMQVNRGGQIDLTNPYSGDVQKAIGVSMTPGQQAQLAQSDRHHANSMGMQQQNANRAQQNSDLDRQLKMLQLDPEFQASKAVTKQKALNTVQAQKDLPGVIDKANESIDLIDNLIGNKDRGINEHPGFRFAVGGTSPLSSATAFVHRGSDAADFNRRMEQIGGQQFLQAFESLKGGGQITEVEGTKATQAISRMNTSSSEDEFIKAAKEFRDIVSKGMERAKSAAGVSKTDGWGDLK